MISLIASQIMKPTKYISWARGHKAAGCFSIILVVSYEGAKREENEIDDIRCIQTLLYGLADSN